MNANVLALDHYAIYVHDLTRSTRFYANVMGLEQIPEPFHDDRHVWFRVGTNQQLHIISPSSGTPTTTDVHFAFRLPSLKEFIIHLSSMGIQYGDQRPDGKIRLRPDGIPQIYFQDPDGYWIEVNEAKY